VLIAGSATHPPEREPYIFHPLRVMLRLGDPADQIAAVPHDAVEDTDLELHHLVEAGYQPRSSPPSTPSPIAPTSRTRSTSSAWLRTRWRGV
jgi:hypothetical protein